jgi:hypothetical protein
MKQLFRLGVMLCFSLLMVAQDDDRHKRGDDRIGHSDKDVERDQDGKLTRHRTEQDGASAQANINTGTPGTTAGVNVNVSRGVTNDVASTTLNYSDFSEPADFSSLTITNIFGTIPNDSFTGDNTKDLVLNLDTSQLDPSTSFSQRCVFTFSPTFSEVCGPAPTGVIHLEFHENGINRTRILDLKEEQVAGPVTTFTHQRSDTGSANFQGTVFGVPVSTSQGTANVGVNHQSTLVITRQ